MTFSPSSEVRDALSKMSHLDFANRIWPNYELIRGGGFSDVHKASLREEIPLEQLGGHKCRFVALKQFRVHVFGSGDFGRMISREVRIWSELRHRNILQLLGFVMRDEYPMLVSAWMDNGTVLQYLRKHMEADVIDMAYGIAAGLRYLHGARIVHADLKSDNVLVSPSGAPMLTDFGISRLRAESDTIAGTTNLKGSARWMAIELFPTEENPSPPLQTYATDVWALGMTFYELLTLSLPYAHLLHDAQVTLAIVNYSLPKEPSDFPKLHWKRRVLWVLCTALWTREPDSRPTTEEIVPTLYGLSRKDARDLGLDIDEVRSKPHQSNGGFGAIVAHVQPHVASTLPKLPDNRVQTPFIPPSQAQTPFIPPLPPHAGVPSTESVHKVPFTNTLSDAWAQSGHAGQARWPAPQPTANAQAVEDLPVLFYVKALYDYKATIDEEFDFIPGDIIAVTSTPEDGWWEGMLMDESRRVRGKTVFPSNFVALF